MSLFALMDPSRDVAGSSEQEAFEALRREELARAQSAAQAQHESSRPTTPSRVPVTTTETGELNRSHTSVESRLKILESELKALMSLRIESESNHPSRRAADVSSSRIPPDRLQEPVSTLINKVQIRNKRFTDVLAVTTYRLVDKNENLPYDQSMSLTQVANQIRPRMEGYFFSGEHSLKVLPFLRHLIRISNQSRLSEATLLWIVEDFLQSPARDAFRAQAHRTWPEAVHWLLITFAPESSLEQAVRSLNLARQAQVETVKQFGLRLQLESSTLGSLISLSETKSLFSQGLNEPVRSLFVAHQPFHELEDTTPLSVLVSRAELLETGTSQRPALSKYMSRPNTRLQTLITPEADHPVEVEDAEEIQAVVFQTHSSSKGLVCFVCYLTGHWWLDCPCLAHIPPEQKEEIAVRRRQYYTEVNSRRRANATEREKGSDPAWMSRPGWKTDRGTVPPAPVWPATVAERSHSSPSENVSAAPKET